MLCNTPDGFTVRKRSSIITSYHKGRGGGSSLLEHLFTCKEIEG